MDRESVERLRFDRRLHTRRGWVEESDFVAYVEALDDVSSKMTTMAELEAEEAVASESVRSAPAEATPASQASPAASAAQGAAPRESFGGPPASRVAGDFSPRSTVGGGGFGAGSDES